jgi:hypothetical protein
MKTIKILGIIILSIFLVVNFCYAQYTGNLCTGGTPIASSSYTTFTPDKAFDGTADPESGANDYWSSDGTVPDEWIGYNFGSSNKKTICQYRIFSANNEKYWIRNN